MKNCRDKDKCDDDYKEKPGNKDKEFVIFPPGFFEAKEHEIHEGGN